MIPVPDRPLLFLDFGGTLSPIVDDPAQAHPHPAVPDLQEDIRQLATFSDNLNQAAPDLLDALDNLTVTSRTIVEKREGLRNLYRSITGASDDLRAFLAQRVAKFKIPRYLWFLDEALPRNAGGKFLKRELRDRLDPADAA